MISAPRTRLLLANPTGRVRPFRSIWTSKSVIARRSCWPLEVNSLGQIGAGQRLPDWVIADVGDLTQTVKQPERMKYASINADADVRIARLDFLEGRAGGEGALGHDRH